MQQCTWQLLYSTAHHGISINTFYRNVSQVGITLLVVEDSQGRVCFVLFLWIDISLTQIFGALAPDTWRKSQFYYGMGDTFLFTFAPKFRKYDFTGENNAIMLSDDKFIALGGGYLMIFMRTLSCV